MAPSQSMSILVAGSDLVLGQALAEHLERRGHLASIADCPREVLSLPTPDVLLLDLELSGGGGFALLAELQRRGNAPRVILYGERPLPEDFRAALRLGASDLLPAPFTFEELMRAIDTPTPSIARQGEYRRTLDATAAGVDLAARDLSAWLLRQGIAPSTRCRVASAVAEAVDNASRHAYLGSVGPVELVGQLDGRRLFVSVRDRGIGMNPAWMNPHGLEDPSGGGLARICSLAEDMSIEPCGGEGTHLVLTFCVYRTAFDEERGKDYSDLDFMTPEQARDVLRNLQDADGAPMHLSPALAVSVGRLLAGPDPQRVLEISLRS